MTGLCSHLELSREFWSYRGSLPEEVGCGLQKRGGLEKGTWEDEAKMLGAVLTHDLARISRWIKIFQSFQIKTYTIWWTPTKGFCRAAANDLAAFIPTARHARMPVKYYTMTITVELNLGNPPGPLVNAIPSMSREISKPASSRARLIAPGCFAK